MRDNRLHLLGLLTNLRITIDSTRFFLFLGFFLAQELENFIAGPHAVHGHVEIAAQPAHGQEEIGGKQDHEDHVGKADAAADKGLRRQQNAQGRAA